MKEALRLARRGLGRTSPNPAVGAVIVRKGRVIAGGFPPILRGVYFLGNGLREGVAMQRSDLAPRVEIDWGGEGPVLSGDDCLLRWDGVSDEFRRVNPKSPATGAR